MYMFVCDFCFFGYDVDVGYYGDCKVCIDCYVIDCWNYWFFVGEYVEDYVVGFFYCVGYFVWIIDCFGDLW